MNLLEQMKTRRSIRKYRTERVEREKLDMIVEAGLYAPNAGARQAAKIIMIDDPELIERIGVINAACEKRNWASGVSEEQPSIIDDLSIKSGFYSCTALGIVCIPEKNKGAVNAIGTGFCAAENMVLEAYDLGVSSCIVGRAEATFNHPEMKGLPGEWGLDPEYTPLVFVCLGYIEGNYPAIKARKEGRSLFIPRQVD